MNGSGVAASKKKKTKKSSPHGGPAAAARNSWSDAACYLFQPTGMLCGSMNVVGSPAAAAYACADDESEHLWTPASYCPVINVSATDGSTPPRAAGPAEQMQMEAAMKDLVDKKYKFQPHMCEDREFFVITGNAGTTSVDVESLSVPSMGDTSDASSFKLEALREAAPTYENQDKILEAPFPILMYPNNQNSNNHKTLKQRIREAAETVKPTLMSKNRGSAAAPMNNMMKGAADMKGERAPEWVVQPSPATLHKKLLESPETTTRIPSKQRVRELLSPNIGNISPSSPPVREDTTTGGTTTGDGRNTSQFGIQSCMIPNHPPTPPGAFSHHHHDSQEQPGGGGGEASLQKQHISSNPNECAAKAEDMEMMRQFWTEKFTQAAQKVIHSESSRRIMELIDPTIPRESDAHRRGGGQHHLRGRQRYRQVLKKYRKYRILVLILDPSSKVYEMLELPYRPDETTVADVLIMARIQTTDDRLRYKDYIGLCRPNLDPPPPPPLRKVDSPPTTTTTTGSTGGAGTPTTSNGSSSVRTTPSRLQQLSPPPLNRVTKHVRHLQEGREDDANSIVSEATAHRNRAASNNSIGSSASNSCMLQEVTDPEELVWNLLSPSTNSPARPVSCSALPSQFALSLPYFTLPLLGDIVVTIPKGYRGEDVSKFAQTILQTPLFLRWMHRRYLNDLQRENDELLSRAKAIGGNHHHSNGSSSGGGSGRTQSGTSGLSGATNSSAASSSLNSSTENGTTISEQATIMTATAR